MREALHKLEMEKLVESIPREGYVVRKICVDYINGTPVIKDVLLD
jgi:DNA-binding GntR family transcriptional regulator